MMSAVNAARSAWAAFLLGAALTTGAAAAETPIKFSLASPFDGPAAPFLLALDKGYDKAEGINVGIEPAAGTPESIKRVASGNYDMGVADINSLIRFRDANPGTPVKAVFIVDNRPPYAIIGRMSRGISRPKDLEGKKLGAPAADEAFAQWPIFAKANDIDVAKVVIENVGFPVRGPMLAAGQVDAITGSSTSTFINLKDKGVPFNDLTLLLMADYGVTLYGSAIIVNTKFAADHADAVSGFLRAFVKAVKETMRSPAAAVEPVLKRSDAAVRDIEVERLRIAIRDNIVTPEVKANGLGGIDNARFAGAIEQIAVAYKFKAAKPKPDDIFDASFLPPAADRKIGK